MFGSVVFPRYSMKKAVSILKLASEGWRGDEALKGSEAGPWSVSVVGAAAKTLKAAQEMATSTRDMRALQSSAAADSLEDIF